MRISSWFRRRTLWAALAALTTAALLAACGSGDDEAPPPAEGSATLDAAGGRVDGPDGVQLNVAPSGLDAPVTIRVARDSGDAPAMAGMNALSPVYAVTPHGQAFGAGASFAIPLAAAQVPAGATPLLLKAEPGGPWRVMANASADPNRLAVDLNDLSFFVIAACSSTPTDAWTIGGVDCPANHTLRLILLDDQGAPVPVPRDANGVPQPVWTVVDRPEARQFRLMWQRAPGNQRVDTVSVVGTPGGFNSTGFRSGLDPATMEVSHDLDLTFSVRIDPARIAGAGAAGGKRLAVKALAEYSTTAFRIGQGNVPVGFTFEGEIPILVRYTGPLPTIDQQPANLGVVPGQAASFSVVASGGTLSYQWQRRTGSTGVFAPIAGATAGTFTLAAAQESDSGAQFSVEVCVSATRCVSSDVATLTVAAANVAPVFSTQPANLAIAAGQTASFTAVATGTPPPQIRWQRAAPNGGLFADVSGVASCATTNPAAGAGNVAATCTVGPVALADSGTLYRAVAVNAAAPAGVISGTAALTVSPAPTPPAITSQPQPQTATVGAGATFRVTATGTAPLAFAWRLGDALPAGGGAFTVGNCSGSVAYSDGGATATFSSLSAGCSGLAVSVTVSNGIAPNATSTPATLTVNAASGSLTMLAGAIGGAGLVDGSGGDVRVHLSSTNGLAFDGQGNLWFSERFSGRVRRLTPGGVASTVAGATTALRNPAGVVVDRAGNAYVAEADAHRILRITPAGVVSTWAGSTQGDQDGTGTAAAFSNPTWLAIDASDNIYVTGIFDGSARKIRRISPTQVVTTLHDFGSTSDGMASIAVAADGSVWGVGTGAFSYTVLRVSPAGVVTSVAGAAGLSGITDGSGAAARFSVINGIALGADGALYVTDNNATAVRRVTAAGVVTSVSGAAVAPREPADGSGTAARYISPGGITAAPGGDLVLGDVAAIRRVTPAFQSTTVTGRYLSSGSTDGSGGSARFRAALDLVLDNAGNTYVADFDRIRKVTPAGLVSTLAVTPARSLALDVDGNLLVAGESAVSRVTLAGTVTLLAGDPASVGLEDGTGAQARFLGIGALAVDAAGNVYVSETQSNVIRRITPTGTVSTWAGDPNAAPGTNGPRASAGFTRPGGLAFDAAGNLFIADNGTGTIRLVTPAGTVSTFAGTAGLTGGTDATGAAARFNNPWRLAFDAAGNLLVGELGNCTVRRITPAAAVSTVLGTSRLCGVSLATPPQRNQVNGLAVRSSGRLVVASELAVLEATVP